MKSQLPSIDFSTEGKNQKSSLNEIQRKFRRMFGKKYFNYEEQDKRLRCLPLEGHVLFLIKICSDGDYYSLKAPDENEFYFHIDHATWNICLIEKLPEEWLQ